MISDVFEGIVWCRGRCAACADALAWLVVKPREISIGVGRDEVGGYYNYDLTWIRRVRVPFHIDSKSSSSCNYRLNERPSAVSVAARPLPWDLTINQAHLTRMHCTENRRPTPISLCLPGSRLGANHDRTIEWRFGDYPATPTTERYGTQLTTELMQQGCQK